MSTNITLPSLRVTREEIDECGGFITLETSAETGDTFSLPRTIQTAKMMIHALQTWARKNLPPDQGESVFDFGKKLEGLLVTFDTEMVEASIHIGIAEKYLKRARGVKS